MKKLIILFAFVSLNSFASDGPFDQINSDKFCSGSKTSDNGHTLICTTALSADQVIKAKLGKSVRKLPNEIGSKILDAIFDFEALPDADTSQDKVQTKTLVDKNNAVIGYFITEFYSNHEMGITVEVRHKYNLLGQLVYARIE